MPQVVLRLLVEPALRRGPEGDREAHGHLRRDAGTAVEDAGERLAADTQGLRRLCNRDAERLQAEGADDFAGVRGVVHAHRQGRFPFSAGGSAWGGSGVGGLGGAGGSGGASAAAPRSLAKRSSSLRPVSDSTTGGTWA